MNNSTFDFDFHELPAGSSRQQLAEILDRLGRVTESRLVRSEQPIGITSIQTIANANHIQFAEKYGRIARAGDELEFNQFGGKKKPTQSTRNPGDLLFRKDGAYLVRNVENWAFVTGDFIDDLGYYSSYPNGQGYYSEYTIVPVEETPIERKNREDVERSLIAEKVAKEKYEAFWKKLSENPESSNHYHMAGANKLEWVTIYDGRSGPLRWGIVRSVAHLDGMMIGRQQSFGDSEYTVYHIPNSLLPKLGAMEEQE